ncbi:GH92 family glycosyl hydrolase [Mucilaginibacter sp.]|uniref:GH92 family glycosyl hydrolase n=1 Tax=Mucilaginibacter sp. TaxID=1882438 RepID=UPI00260B5C43|nr:GH92 family glycosyl hydrolase [Mucilaginibacter sp.]MDB4920681.1 alpha,2-mannosidase [Mucilaginibacter sp.]
MYLIKRKSFLLLLCAPFVSFNSLYAQQDPLKFVDPYIGSGGHGHTFVGASVPFGAVQVGPNNINKGWDWCSGYHYSDSLCIGFSQTHLSGTGIGDLGDILIMPYTGSILTDKGTQQNPGYASHYKHSDEVVKPQYYSLKMDNQVKVELTASERVAFHQYSFPANKQVHIIIDLSEGNNDQSTDTYIKLLDKNTIIGYRFSKGWAKDQRIWFAIKSSIDIDKFNVFDLNTDKPGAELQGKHVKGVISFANTPQKVMLKVGISPVSSNNALANINAEIPGWNFTGTVNQARIKWENELSKITVETKDDAHKRTFYTALYHTMIDPALYNDHNGAYRGTDKKLYKNPGFDNYSVFSLWDTYRSAAPLSTIIHTDKINSFINSLLAAYQQQGKLPIWPLMGNETDCMVGYHSVPLIVDAYLKGYRGFDVKLAYEAIIKSSTRDDYGMKYIKQMGYIPADKQNESLSRALEYAVDDWCIAQMAKKLGKTADAALYTKRAGYYKNYFDASIKFMRPKLSDGSWKTPYDPLISNKDFTEGNGWQYTWLVPQDVEGLITLMGGDKAFCDKLDELFKATGSMGPDAPSDISGLIGMYAHGNEPSHHVIYMYAYAGQQWKTAEKVRQVMNEFYTDKIDGLAGNEDCGAMSSWYVMSAMGFYPCNPASGTYVLGSPLFNKVKIKVNKGASFSVNVVNNSSKNIYIQKVIFNGTNYNHSYLKHKDIMKGGNLQIVMGHKPNYNFGKLIPNRPKSAVED